MRGDNAPSLPSRGAAAEIHAVLDQRGALFFDEIVAATRRLATDVERGLRGLIALGLVHSDGSRSLRAIAGGHARVARRTSSLRRPRRASSLARGAAAGPAGRWALLPAARSSADGAADAAAPEIELLAEQVAELLLRRYGVVFRDAVSREPFTVPWRELLRALRRMKARGTVRGGRFVSGFVGEQYALPEAVDSLRRVRREPRDGERVTVSAADPLNLTGSILPGPRLASLPGRSITLVDGVPEGHGDVPAEAAVAAADEQQAAESAGD